jgi:hypothetical protein
MADLALSAWYDDVLPQVSECPVALADWAIRKAAIEFCDRSHAHIVDLTAINSVVGTADYALTAPAGSEIVKVIAVLYDGDEIKPISPRDVARSYGDDWADLQEEPERFLSQYGTSLKLIPKPATAVTAGIVPTVVLRPTAAATTIAEVIGTLYKEEIAKGARKTLWLMPKKPWTTFDRGNKEEQDFFEACAVAHSQAQKGRTGAAMRNRNYYYPEA